MPKEGCVYSWGGKIANTGTICWRGERGIRLGGCGIYAVGTYQTPPGERGEGIKRRWWATGRWMPKAVQRDEQQERCKVGGGRGKGRGGRKEREKGGERN